MVDLERRLDPAADLDGCSRGRRSDGQRPNHATHGYRRAGLWTEKSSQNGKDTSGQYRFTDTFIKRDGRWQAVATYSTKLQ